MRSMEDGFFVVVLLAGTVLTSVESPTMRRN
jgi:hypothetical protein